MIIFIILILLLFTFSYEKFSNAFSNQKPHKNKNKILKDYLEKFTCSNFNFIDSHPDYIYTKDEILKMIQPIVQEININLKTNYILFQVNKVNKYLGNYYHLIFSVVENHSINLIETKLRVNSDSSIQIKEINLFNSKLDTINGYETSSLDYNNGIVKEEYDWMFDLSKGDMGFPHGISNKTGY
jgi:hypothetical protein